MAPSDILPRDIRRNATPHVPQISFLISLSQMLHHLLIEFYCWRFTSVVPHKILGYVEKRSRLKEVLMELISLKKGLV